MPGVYFRNILILIDALFLLFRFYFKLLALNLKRSYR